MKEYLLKVQKCLFVVLVLGAPFSKYPSLAMPMQNFDSFRIGIYQVLLTLFVVVSLVFVIRDMVNKRITHKDQLLLGVVGLLLFVASIGLGRAENTSRSALMVASFGLLLLALVSGFYFVKNVELNRQKLVRYMLIAGIGYGIVSFAQLALGTFVSRESALLCSGCGSDVFGFVRISGFASEPLFWANALIPFFVVSYLQYCKHKSRLALYSLIAVSFAIAVTFARGAYLAVVVIVFVDLVRKLNKKVGVYLKPIVVTGVGMVAGLLLLITSASIRYSESPYIAYNTTAGMIEHLTLGVVSPELRVPTANTTTIESVSDENDFVTEGLVEESGQDRLGAAEIALNAWGSNSNMVFGVGLGNLGPYVVANIDATAPNNLTVYIFYVLFLVEMGIAGFLLLSLLYLVAIRRLIRQNAETSWAVLLVLVGFLVQYFFFGSYINVTYIWLWLGIGLGLQAKSTKTL